MPLSDKQIADYEEWLNSFSGDEGAVPALHLMAVTILNEYKKLVSKEADEPKRIGMFSEEEKAEAQEAMKKLEAKWDKK